MQREKLMKRLAGGFSLIELLVVVTVIAILAAVAMPSFSKMLETRRLVAATEGVYAHLQFARSEAIKFGSTDLNFSIKPGTAWCLGISNAASCDCGTAAACRYGPDIDGDGNADMERNLPSSDFTNISMTTPTADTNISISSIRGAFGLTGGTIVLKSSSNFETRIIFTRLGRVRICTPNNVGGYPAC